MNVAERAILRVQVNTITALYPEKLPSQTQDAQLPHGLEEVGNGYALLWPLDNTSRDVMPNKKEAILSFWCDKVVMVPDFQVDAEGGVTVPENAWFLLEKPFLETNAQLGIVDHDDDDEDDEGS
ncbi:hypothetical protein V5O48_012065 [Marasmius crinis-equi]|uniref:Uncharacterized protein n=1 Tax=Marasmius crinis-equi TaxID=585013 RepID=A0ABR3F442_9AGAR